MRGMYMKMLGYPLIGKGAFMLPSNDAVDNFYATIADAPSDLFRGVLPKNGEFVNLLEKHILTKPSHGRHNRKPNQRGCSRRAQRMARNAKARV